jgi:hypothetical protein
MAMSNANRPVLVAIAAVMSEVGSVKKEGTNEFHRYKYATAADVLHKLQPLMAKHGLTIIQHQRSLDFIQDGAAMAIAYEFHVMHSSGDALELHAVHTGVAAAKTSKGTPDDKAANKCHTAARKYFLLSLFQIPTGDYDEDESDAPTRKKATPKAESAAVKAAAEQKPGIFLDTGGGCGSTHATAGAFLDELERLVKTADDPMMIFDLNSKTLEAIQSKAIKAKNEGMAGRVKAIYDSLHSDPVPDLV